ncbi:YbhB/YbcL family Raf kinase inhibitor-like protein [Candidatus Giovannonibacteria bacterium]|nr:YbhB/YbcL family Raf kinase inhibitor-like protein [Candidatus Giovannonibacteria bacterium]
MKLKSNAFQQNGDIPSKYTCEGEDINPPLSISDVSAETKSLVLIMDDPDSPGAPWLHWTLFNIDPKTTEIPENGIPEGAMEGTTSFAQTGYGGPCPKMGPKVHRYYFKLYALDKSLDIRFGATRADIENAMERHIIAQAELMGIYSLQKK